MPRPDARLPRAPGYSILHTSNSGDTNAGRAPCLENRASSGLDIYDNARV